MGERQCEPGLSSSASWRCWRCTTKAFFLSFSSCANQTCEQTPATFQPPGPVRNHSPRLLLTRMGFVHGPWLIREAARMLSIEETFDGSTGIGGPWLSCSASWLCWRCTSTDFFLSFSSCGTLKRRDFQLARLFLRMCQSDV